MSSFKAEASVYADHVGSLLVPGRKVKTHESVAGPAAETGTLEGWTDDDLQLLLEEGRRTLDRQASGLDRVRGTAQVLLPTATALLVIFGTELQRVQLEPTTWLRWAMYGLWFLGTLLVLLSGLGAAAILSVRGEFGAVLPTLLSQEKTPVLRETARAYAEQMAIGANTVATRITLVRDAVTLFALGGLVYLALWLIRVL